MHPTLRKLLVYVLTMDAVAVIVSMLWMFQRIDSSLGDDLAEVVVALISVVDLALVLLGIRTGLAMDRYIRRRRPENFRVYQASHQIRYLCSLLGYGAPVNQPPHCKPASQEILALMEKPRRRGRPPTYTIDRWKRVVLAWENRDPLRNSLTLTEFLSEQFGVYADGSPRMSENSYYDWRKKVIEEMRSETEGPQIQTG